LSRSEIIKKLKEKNPKLSQSDLIEALEVFSETIKKALIDGKSVELRNFGTFFIKKIKEKHSARNPKTGELIYIPEKNRVRFKASKKLKQFINK
tara:strand:- start:752 stop:1033 length:282 start_codon:yes stop_codon:yes gene_type:complete